MLQEGNILYVDTGTINHNNPRIYEINKIFFQDGRAWCVCHLYYENKIDVPNFHMKLSSIEAYIERATYDKEIKCVLIDEPELAKFLLERDDV